MCVAQQCSISHLYLVLDSSKLLFQIPGWLLVALFEHDLLKSLSLSWFLILQIHPGMLYIIFQVLQLQGHGCMVLLCSPIHPYFETPLRTIGVCVSGAPLKTFFEFFHYCHFLLANVCSFCPHSESIWSSWGCLYSLVLIIPTVLVFYGNFVLCFIPSRMQSEGKKMQYDLLVFLVFNSFSFDCPWYQKSTKHQIHVCESFNPKRTSFQI